MEVILLKEKLENRLLEEVFLKKYDLEKEEIRIFLEDKSFLNNLSKMLECGNYKSQSIYELIKPFLETLFPKNPPQDPLMYMYEFSLILAFPHVISFKRRDDMEKATHVFLTALQEILQWQKSTEDGSWQSRYPMNFLGEEDMKNLEDRTEYDCLMRAFRKEYTYELMKLNQDIVGYSTLDHVCGVHHLAMKVARQLRHLNLPLDMGRVSGAAAAHDVGKYGCRKEEQSRVAYFHYYYTGQWFKARNIVYIRNVAIHHSTWDLELENLPIESLILIYSDFRVKSNKKNKMTYYSLDDAFQVILDKLDSVDEKKEKRYRRVYRKLKDFEDYMLYLGVNVDPDSIDEIKKGHVLPTKHYSLLQGKDILQHVKYASIAHNIRLLYHLRNETSLGKMLESARDLGDLSGLRGYIQILEEYHTYLTQKQKLIVIRFLYDQLIIPEEDIRKQCASLLGTIVGTYDEELRKERPEDVIDEKLEVTSDSLFKRYFEDFLYPDQKIIAKHRGWISYSAVSMVQAYFNAQTNWEKRKKAISIVLSYIICPEKSEDIRFYLLAILPGLPLSDCTENEIDQIVKYTYERVIDSRIDTKLAAFQALETMMPYAKVRLQNQYRVGETLSKGLESSSHPGLNFARLRLVEDLELEDGVWERYANACREDLKNTSSLFLSNLKSATHFIAKRLQVELLIKHTITEDYKDAFYTAMHFCNLLKVSAVETVRNRAGAGLVELVPHLSFEQRNDIVIELLRALEMESYQFTRYIPQYLGRVILYIPPQELDEILESFQEKTKSTNTQIATLMIKTVGYALTHYADYEKMCSNDKQGYKRRLISMLGILLSGFVNPNPVVNQMAFRVIGRRIFNAKDMDSQLKVEIFKISIKKILALMVDTNEAIELIFFNNAAGLKNIYRFLSEESFEQGEIVMPLAGKAAFFPGSFDPFSLSHKEIAKAIRDMGFEVYLAVDEFSWSKRTQANLIRRDIIKMSVADEINIYTYPRDLPTNIANPIDIEMLKKKFHDMEVYIVAGADVIVGASAYDEKSRGKGVMSLNHIVFERPSLANEKTDKMFEEKFAWLPQKSIRLRLSDQFTDISSTQIRDYVDENRDISELVDPLAQKFIYERGLYQREPLYKEVLTTKSLTLEIIDNPTATLLEELSTVVSQDFTQVYTQFKEVAQKKENFRVLILRRVDKSRQIIGFSAFHWLRTTDIYLEFEDVYLSDFIREHSVGRLVVIDGIYKNKNDDLAKVEQRLLTETLAFCLARDYSYAIYKDTIGHNIGEALHKALRLQGFMKISKRQTEQVYVANMSTPCTLNMDVKSLLKAPFRSMPEVVEVVEKSRIRLQKALTTLYPGHLVLTFNRTMIYEHLIKKICDENNMPTVPLVPKQTGAAMCVPFGHIFNRWRIPNTITKSLHTEKFFESNLKTHQIQSAPHYLCLQNQVSTIKSFKKPVILVDDLLNKGYRIKVLKPIFEDKDVTIQKFFVGILSGRGKAIMEKANIEVDSAYFIPRLKAWFTESKMYPFIGGDIFVQELSTKQNVSPSANLILPYTFPSYIRDASPRSIYSVSETALTNSIKIMETLEDVYQKERSRILTLSRLGEVFLVPKIPQKGSHIIYDMNQRATTYLKNERDHLIRLKSIFI